MRRQKYYFSVKQTKEKPKILSLCIVLGYLSQKLIHYSIFIRIFALVITLIIMKSKGLFLCLLSGVLGLIGCAPKKMPEGDLIRVEYTRSGTMAGYEFEGRVEQDSAGSFVIRAMKESYGALYEKKVSPEVLQHFRQIIEEEKMYKYKESYRPKLEVLDGWGWSFSAKFSDGSSIYSHGSNASPSGNGLGKIWGYMESLIEEGGVKIKDAPFEQDETDLNESDN